MDRLDAPYVHRVDRLDVPRPANAEPAQTAEVVTTAEEVKPEDPAKLAALAKLAESGGAPDATAGAESLQTS